MKDFETAKLVIQAIGRAKRSKEEPAVAIIMDNRFETLLKRDLQKLYPAYWQVKSLKKLERIEEITQEVDAFWRINTKFNI